MQEQKKKKKVLAAQRRKLRDLSLNAQYWSEEENKKHMVMEQIERFKKIFTKIFLEFV